MSITISSNIECDTIEKEEPCMCAQMAPHWSDFYEGTDTPAIRAELREYAHSKCPSCQGKGVEIVPQDVDFPTINLSNDNAKILFDILGANINSEDGMVGEMSISKARQCVMRAQSRESLDRFVRPESKSYGKPREVSPGVVDLKPVKMWDMGLSEEKIQRYIRIFAEFVIEVSKRGATKIMWS